MFLNTFWTTKDGYSYLNISLISVYCMFQQNVDHKLHFGYISKNRTRIKNNDPNDSGFGPRIAERVNYCQKFFLKNMHFFTHIGYECQNSPNITQFQILDMTKNIWKIMKNFDSFFAPKRNINHANRSGSVLR